MPSTFTMYTSMLGLSSFFKTILSGKIIEVIFFFFLGNAVGWPFPFILVIPIVFYDFLMSIHKSPLKSVFLKYLKALFVCFTILVCFLCIDDNIFYHN